METEGATRAPTIEGSKGTGTTASLVDLIHAMSGLAAQASSAQLTASSIRSSYQAIIAQVPAKAGLDVGFIHARAQVLAALIRAEAKERGETLSPAQAMEKVAAFLLDKLDGSKPTASPGAAEIIKRWSTDWRPALRPEDPNQAAFLAEAASVISDIQARFSDQGQICRAQHAKALFVTADASFTAVPNLPPEINFGPFAEKGQLRAIVRLSSVSGRAESDDKPDLRGIAIRLTDDKGHLQDLLLNTSEQFMAPDAKGALLGAAARGQGLGALVKGIFSGKMGPIDAVKMVIAGKQVQSKDKSLAAHTFWSRTPFRLGEYAVKIRLRPAVETDPKLATNGPDELSQDFNARLKQGPIRYKLEVQGFESKQTTPLDDARETWNTPWVTVGELTFNKQGAVGADAAERVAKEIDQLAFGISNRWDADERSLKGVGDINALREGSAYKASADGRGVDPTQGKRCPYGFG